MKQFKITNPDTGIEFLLERETLEPMQPEWGLNPVVVIEDKTDELALENYINKANMAMEVGKQIIAAIWATTARKDIHEAEFTRIFENPSFRLLERHLHNGNLKHSRDILLSMDETLFSASEKADFLKIIKDSNLLP